MKKFLRSICKFLFIGLIPFIIFIMPSIFIIPNLTGDLGKFGIQFGQYDTIFKNADYCFVENVDNFDYLDSVEILTIGDSFSQQNINGYQNYLGHTLGKKIYNFRILNYRPENTVFTLLEENFLKNCKILIVESVERTFIWTLCNEFYKIDSIEYKTILTSKQNIDLTSNNNFQTDKYVRLFDIKKLLDYYKTITSSTSPVIDLKLSQNFFSSEKYSNTLFFYNNKNQRDGDLMFQNLTINQINMAKKNLNKLYDIANKRGVKLFFLVPANKYDLYYNWIINNPYPKDYSLDYFNDFDTIKFINTKKLLLTYIENGCLDIYKVNDTHWSNIASKIVGEYLADIIIQENY